MRLSILLVGAFACHSATRTPLYKAGDDKDEGGGELARKSIRLTIDGEAPPAAFAQAGTQRTYDGFGGDGYGGDPYGGGMYGGDPYGGTSYGGWAMRWNYTTPNRTPHYNVATGLTAAVEGVVSWTGGAPGKLASACGAIDNPTLRVSSDRTLRGVIVYIENVSIGRAPPYYARPLNVGGVLTKRGCTLSPAAQIVTPLPASLAIHGDAQRTRVRATPTGGSQKTYQLDELGVVSVEIKAGVTKIAGEDGKLGAAWVLGLETPYYAITDDGGRYRIDELAPGTYDVTFWQPPIATAGPDGVLVYGAPIVAHRSVKVEAGKAASLSIALSGR